MDFVQDAKQKLKNDIIKKLFLLKRKKQLFRNLLEGAFL